MPYDLVRFRESLASPEIIDQCSDLFESNCKVIALADDLGQHVWSCAPGNPSAHDLNLRCGVMDILTGLKKTVDGVMILSAFGQGPEACVIARSLWESMLDIYFISTDIKRWLFFYNRRGRIALLLKSDQIQANQDLFKGTSVEGFPPAGENLDQRFQELKSLFDTEGFEFPSDLAELKKRFKTSWCGLTTTAMIYKIGKHHGDGSQLHRSLKATHMVDFSLASQLSHGEGIHSITTRKRANDRDAYDASRGPEWCDNALRESLSCASLILRILVEAFPLQILDGLKQRILKYTQVA